MPPLNTLLPGSLRLGACERISSGNTFTNVDLARAEVLYCWEILVKAVGNVFPS